MRAHDADFTLLTLNRDGRIADPYALDRFQAGLPVATDCFLFCPGWLEDRQEVRQAAARFFSLLDGALQPLGDRVIPLRVAVYWPAKPFGNTPDDLEPEIFRGMSDLRRRQPGVFSRLLLTIAEAEVPRSPEEEYELDGLLRVL